MLTPLKYLDSSKVLTTVYYELTEEGYYKVVDDPGNFSGDLYTFVDAMPEIKQKTPEEVNAYMEAHPDATVDDLRLYQYGETASEVDLTNFFFFKPQIVPKRFIEQNNVSVIGTANLKDGVTVSLSHRIFEFSVNSNAIVQVEFTQSEGEDYTIESIVEQINYAAAYDLGQQYENVASIYVDDNGGEYIKLTSIIEDGDSSPSVTVYNSYVAGALGFLNSYRVGFVPFGYRFSEYFILMKETVSPNNPAVKRGDTTASGIYIPIISDNNIMRFLPEFDKNLITNNKRLKLLVDGYAYILDNIGREISKIGDLVDVNNLESQYLKYIAYSLGYNIESVPTTVEGKRELIKSLINIYRIKGAEYSFGFFFGYLGLLTSIIERRPNAPDYSNISIPMTSVEILEYYNRFLNENSANGITSNGIPYCGRNPKQIRTMETPVADFIKKYNFIYHSPDGKGITVSEYNDLQLIDGFLVNDGRDLKATITTPVAGPYDLSITEPNPNPTNILEIVVDGDNTVTIDFKRYLSFYKNGIDSVTAHEVKKVIESATTLLDVEVTITDRVKISSKYYGAVSSLAITSANPAFGFIGNESDDPDDISPMLSDIVIGAGSCNVSYDPIGIELYPEVTTSEVTLTVPYALPKNFSVYLKTKRASIISVEEISKIGYTFPGRKLVLSIDSRDEVTILFDNNTTSTETILKRIKDKITTAYGSIYDSRIYVENDRLVITSGAAYHPGNIVVSSDSTVVGLADSPLSFLNYWYSDGSPIVSVVMDTPVINGGYDIDLYDDILSRYGDLNDSIKILDIERKINDVYVNGSYKVVRQNVKSEMVPLLFDELSENQYQQIKSYLEDRNNLAFYNDSEDEENADIKTVYWRPEKYYKMTLELGPDSPSSIQDYTPGDLVALASADESKIIYGTVSSYDTVNKVVAVILNNANDYMEDIELIKPYNVVDSWYDSINTDSIKWYQNGDFEGQVREDVDIETEMGKSIFVRMLVQPFDPDSYLDTTLITQIRDFIEFLRPVHVALTILYRPVPEEETADTGLPEGRDWRKRIREEDRDENFIGPEYSETYKDSTYTADFRGIGPLNYHNLMLDDGRNVANGTFGRHYLPSTSIRVVGEDVIGNFREEQGVIYDGYISTAGTGYVEGEGLLVVGGDNNAYVTVKTVDVDGGITEIYPIVSFYPKGVGTNYRNNITYDGTGKFVDIHDATYDLEYYATPSGAGSGAKFTISRKDFLTKSYPNHLYTGRLLGSNGNSFYILRDNELDNEYAEEDYISVYYNSPDSPSQQINVGTIPIKYVKYRPHKEDPVSLMTATPKFRDQEITSGLFRKETIPNDEIYGRLHAVEIIEPGLGYNVDDVLILAADETSDAQIKVEEVSSLGEIVAVSVLSAGSYTDFSNGVIYSVTNVNSPSGSDATFKVTAIISPFYINYEMNVPHTQYKAATAAQKEYDYLSGSASVIMSFNKYTSSPEETFAIKFQNFIDDDITYTAGSVHKLMYNVVSSSNGATLPVNFDTATRPGGRTTWKASSNHPAIPASIKINQKIVMQIAGTNLVMYDGLNTAELSYEYVNSQKSYKMTTNTTKVWLTRGNGNDFQVGDYVTTTYGGYGYVKYFDKDANVLYLYDTNGDSSPDVFVGSQVISNSVSPIAEYVIVKSETTTPNSVMVLDKVHKLIKSATDILDLHLLLPQYEDYIMVGPGANCRSYSTTYEDNFVYSDWAATVSPPNAYWDYDTNTGAITIYVGPSIPADLSGYNITAGDYFIYNSNEHHINEVDHSNGVVYVSTGLDYLNDSPVGDFTISSKTSDRLQSPIYNVRNGTWSAGFSLMSSTHGLTLPWTVTEAVGPKSSGEFDLSPLATDVATTRFVNSVNAPIWQHGSYGRLKHDGTVSREYATIPEDVPVENPDTEELETANETLVFDNSKYKIKMSIEEELIDSDTESTTVVYYYSPYSMTARLNEAFTKIHYNLSSALTISTRKITLDLDNTSGTFIVGEQVTSSSSPSSGTVYHYNSKDGYVYLTDITGTFSGTLTGVASGAAGSILSSSSKTLSIKTVKPYGSLLFDKRIYYYVDKDNNYWPICRTEIDGNVYKVFIGPRGLSLPEGKVVNGGGNIVCKYTNQYWQNQTIREGHSMIVRKNKVVEKIYNLYASPAPGTFIDGEVVEDDSPSPPKTAVVSRYDAAENKLYLRDISSAFLPGAVITGRDSAATAVLSSISNDSGTASTYYVLGSQYAANSGYTGDSKAYGNTGYIDSVSINTAGSGYSVGQEITVNDTVSPEVGKNAKIIIDSVDSSGAVLTVRILHGGQGYTDGIATVDEAGGLLLDIITRDATYDTFDSITVVNSESPSDSDTLPSPRRRSAIYYIG